MWTSPSRPWQETLERARWAERAGFAAIWFADHLMPNTADDSPDSGPMQECWSVLSALGALVPRVRLVSMVSPRPGITRWC